MELADVQFEYANDIAGFLSFGLEKRYVKISPHHRYFFPVTTYYFFVRPRALNRHVQGERMQTAITLLLGFRNYLHYHIKCSKTYLHMRMRKRVAGWMQVLNRAVPEVETEKKTAAGKTFSRKWVLLSMKTNVVVIFTWINYYILKHYSFRLRNI